METAEVKKQMLKDSIDRYKEQLRALTERLKEIEQKFERLSQAGLAEGSKAEIEGTLAALYWRLEMLEDYITTFKLELELEDGPEYVKANLDRLAVKYGYVPENAVDILLPHLVARVKRLQQLYQERLANEAFELMKSAFKLHEEINETVKKALQDLR